MQVGRDDILAVLRTIQDPEMPISIIDLGIVENVRIEPNRDHHEAADVAIDVLPTFVGCPALDMIRDEIVQKVGAIDGIGTVKVELIFDPPWSVDRMTRAGWDSLRAHGVTVPAKRDGSVGLDILKTTAVACPFCGSSSTRLDSPFGPTRCRSIYYCESCRNSFEHMKRV